MKTTLAQLYTKATLCENREEHSSEACGHCQVCKTGEHPNITYYRITEASSFKEVVGDLISISKSAPAIMTDELRADNHRRFIIIDELQNATRQSISPFLDSLEFASDQTTVILVSMDLDKLDAIVRDAIESRCIELSLDTISVESIADKIYTKHPKVEYEALILIAKLAKGNMRKAWSIFEYFIAQVSEEELTAKLVYELKYGGLNEELRTNFFDSLYSKEWDQTKLLLKSFRSKTNDEIIAKTLLDDLISFDLTEEGIELISSLSVWLQSTYKIPVDAVFIRFQGELLQHIEAQEIPDKIYTGTVVERVVSAPSGYLPLESTPRAIRQATDSVLDQFKNITGKKVVVQKELPEWFNFNSWKQLLEWYDTHNR